LNLTQSLARLQHASFAVASSSQLATELDIDKTPRDHHRRCSALSQRRRVYLPHHQPSSETRRRRPRFRLQAPLITTRQTAISSSSKSRCRLSQSSLSYTVAQSNASDSRRLVGPVEMRSCRLRRLVTLATALTVLALPDMGRGSRDSRRVHRGPQPLAIWIDKRQIEQLFGNRLVAW